MRKSVFKKPWNEMRQATRNYYERRAARAVEDEKLFSHMLDDMHILDAKSSGLITFISLALAALTFALTLVDNSMEYARAIKATLICFIGIFSIAAWFSLRCLEITGPPFSEVCKDVETEKQLALAELAARRYNYFLALRVTRYAFSALSLLVCVWLGMVAQRFY
jgi:hypothetical protein